MNRLQALLTICFTLSVPFLVLSGQAKLGALILATAMAASIVTVLYAMAFEAKREAVHHYHQQKP